jgi:Na+(H+)/acetate symporter ActP
MLLVKCVVWDLFFLNFLEVDINTGVVIGMIIVLFYAVLGGMKGITYTQVAQYCGFDICFYGSCNFYFDSNDRKPYTTVRNGWHC